MRDPDNLSVCTVRRPMNPSPPIYNNVIQYNISFRPLFFQPVVYENSGTPYETIRVNVQ